MRVDERYGLRPHFLTIAAGEVGEVAGGGGGRRETFNGDLTRSTEMDLKGNSTRILLLEETETKANEGIS